MLNIPNVFFDLKSRRHQFVSATEAAEPKIGAGPENEPTLLPARVSLFHGKNIAYFDIHTNLREILIYS